MTTRPPLTRIETFVASIATAMRHRPPSSSAVMPDEPIIPNLSVSWGGGDAVIDILAETTPEVPLSLTVRCDGKPQWFVLNINLGPGTFGARDSFGLAMRMKADRPLSLSAFIRSSPVINDAQDTQLDEPLVLNEGMEAALAVHRFKLWEHAVAVSDYHTLSLRLPARNFRLDLHGIAVFLRPAIPVGPRPGSDAPLPVDVEGS